MDTKQANDQTFARFPLDVSFQGINRLFALAFNNTAVMLLVIQLTILLIEFKETVIENILNRVNITKYNALIDDRNFYDLPINGQIKKYDEIRKVETGKVHEYTTGCLVDYQYFKDHYQLTAVDLSKQKELDGDPRAIQQIEFYRMLKINAQVFALLEKSKETLLESYKGTANVL